MKPLCLLERKVLYPRPCRGAHSFLSKPKGDFQLSLGKLASHHLGLLPIKN